MKVFISSLISGFEQERQAVKDAITTLRHQAVTAEEFGAQPHSPQVACLQELRQSDLVILVLGEAYGAVQAGSGLSATHEEYRQARGQKPVIAFVQQGVTPDPAQAAFITEVQGWEGGLFRGAFHAAQDLQVGVTRALHDYDMAKVVGPVDLKVLSEQALSLLAPTRHNSSYADGASLKLAVVGGPLQQILRPIQIEARDLAEALHQAGLFGDVRIFDGAKGIKIGVIQGDLVLSQERGASVRLTEQGTIVLQLSMDPPQQTGRGGYMPVLIEEVVQQQIGSALAYSNWLLDRIDPTQRLTHVAVAARIDGAEHLAWRSSRDAASNSVTMGSSFGRDKSPVTVTRQRAGLRLDRTHLVEDLLVPLRRQWQTK